jgi:hypothetical protein
LSTNTSLQSNGERIGATLISSYSSIMVVLEWDPITWAHVHHSRRRPAAKRPDAQGSFHGKPATEKLSTEPDSICVQDGAAIGHSMPTGSAPFVSYVGYSDQ